VPTPRGGGVAIVAAQGAALAVLRVMGYMTLREFLALIAGGGAVALVGFLDDRRSLAASVRFAVHLGAAILVTAAVGGVPLPGVEDGGRGAWIGDVIGVAGIAWAINLFNFMDGIDGIAGSEAVFISWTAAALILALRGPVGVAGAFGALGAASLGFLVWNWPPARIFMGDVGSGFLGFTLAALAILASRRAGVALQVWPILWGVFLVDASVTLLRRMLRGDRWYEAHRTHAYQHLARDLGGHLKTTLLVCAVNVLWLLPWAWYAANHPSAATRCFVFALLPILTGVMWARAGCP
jgi:Fuc2NAc and GlcNAc transferase